MYFLSFKWEKRGKTKKGFKKIIVMTKIFGELNKNYI